MQLRLPELGEGVHEGELVKWRVKPGDSVKYDQPLCDVMTDKATVEIPSPFEGRVAELHAKEGEAVKIGQLIMSFEGSQKTAQKFSQAESGTKADKKQEVPPTSPSMPGVGMMASPSTRRIAREKGVDLGAVKGTGPHGRIMREDVERVVAGAVGGKEPVGRPKEQPEEQRVPLHGLRKIIAERMRLSKDKAAHFTYVEEADATALVELRAQAKEVAEKLGIKMTYLPFVMKAMVEALRQFPALNSILDEEKNEIVYKNYFNIGLSIQTDEGLVAPNIKNVEEKSIMQLAREIQDLVDRARHKRLKLEDLHGGTITLTNAGSIGGLLATPIINYPEVAILGFNKISRKPVVKRVFGSEEIVIRDWTYFSLSLDHRVVDGAVGAEFMKLFIRYIESPTLLLLGAL
ncbi:MAG: dihydrolipoamide acetyltransferase family protein [Bdellovibrionota bacterium]